MRHWKIHLAWAVATPVFALAWGNWTESRGNAPAPVLDRAVPAAPEAGPGRFPDQVAGSSLPHQPAPVASPEEATPTEEEVYVETIRRLFRSDRKEDQSEGEQMLQRIPPGRVRIDLLCEELHCKDDGCRYSALLGLYDPQRKESLPIFLNLLKTEPQAYIRGQAAQFLGVYGDPAAVNVLLEATRDPDRAVRLAAAGSLSRLGHCGPAADFLSQMAFGLESSDGGLRREAAWNISQLRIPSAIPLLLHSFHDVDGGVREEAARGLSMMEAPDLVPTLEKLSVDSDPKVAKAAQDALSRYKVAHAGN